MVKKKVDELVFYDTYDSPLCSLIFFGDNYGLKKIVIFNKEHTQNKNLSLLTKNEQMFAIIKQQMKEYFKGDRQKFDININIIGTIFEQKVLKELLKIPYGNLVSYSYIAEKIGNKKACRAVGMANNKNPFPIIIPCHRVIGKNGSLTGFGSGIDIKEKLIRHELANINKTDAKY